jgi:predicted ATPase/signal transduction histidine kinase
MIEFLEGYEFQEVIYQDNSTVIYRGLEESAKLPVLVKFIDAEFPTLVEIARLKHEYGILQYLDDFGIAGIIKPLSLKELRRGSALVMEYAGEPLSKLLSHRALEYGEFLKIAIQLADILAPLHSTCKVIHKNLKTANVLFDLERGQVKLSNFSYATRLSTENQTISNTRLGNAASFVGIETFAYISPEQTGRMNRSTDYRTDFYSLGVIFYEMLTQQLPFEPTDPLELVYSHIAKAPVSPRIIASSKGLKEIPQGISDVVMKLLAKTPEDRYQNALGLKADLEKCLKELETGIFEPFEVGKLDLFSQFVIPQKLYGRSTEVVTLMSAFARVSAGATEMMLVSGYSGIGKSSLVYEVQKPIVEARGYFIKGKFDQFKRNIPYAALIQAFQELMQQLLTESVERINYWHLKILEALGGNGQVVIDVIPEVELIIGVQDAAPELGASESENRFNRVFEQFIKVFCQKEHPLVIFLDDLQWSDSASLKLINLLMRDFNSEYLLIIVAYRDNEVNARHPLIVTINEIRENKATINNIVLAPLQLTHVTQLIADTFRSEISIITSLAQLIYNKTQGNPFFVSQLLKSLYQDNLLFFDFEQGCWQWNIETLQGINISANVVELMVNQIQKLSPTNQNILKLAACIGDKFSLDVLSIVNQKSFSQTALDLWSALQAGLILPMNEAYKIPLVINLEELTTEQNNASDSQPIIIYRFLHDRVQQAAYSLIPEIEKPQTHLNIGQLLLEHTPKSELEDKIFEIVNHFNIGSELITSQLSKNYLAELNLIAGRKAKAAIAYEPALKYLRTALSLLANDSWTHQYNLTINIYDSTIKAEFLNGNYQQSQALIDIALKQIKTLLDTVNIYKRKIQVDIGRGNFTYSIDTALLCLQMLEVRQPTTEPEITHYCEQLKQELEFENSQIADLINLPDINNPYKKAAIEILNTMPGPVYINRPQLFMPMMLTMTNISVKHGNCATSAFAYCIYGMLLCAVYRDIERGYEFGKLSLQVLDKYNDKALRANVLKVYASHIQHSKEHIRAAIQTLQLASESAIETGNPEFLAYGNAEYVIYSFFSGENLEVIARKSLPLVEQVESFKQELGIYYIRISRQIVLNLISNENHHTLTGESFNEETMLPTVIAANWKTLLFCFYLFKLILAYLFKDYVAALAYTTTIEENLVSVAGMMMEYKYNFYHSLTLLKVYSSSQDQALKQQYLNQVELNQETLHYRAKNAPCNFLHKYELVEAEKARCLGQNDRAIEYYERAVIDAKEHGYLQEEALALELTAEFMSARGRERIAFDYLIDAYYAYQRWGATAKVLSLKQRYPKLASLNQTQATKTPSSTFGLASFDLATFIKASHALSDEIVLEKLLDKLINIVIENAGARTGMLLLQQQGQWVLVASGFADRDNIILLPPQVLSTSPDNAVALINYVARSQTRLVLNNATTEGLFVDDAYIKKFQPKSILCLPIIYQNQLKGILYLENNLLSSAFTQNHIEVLTLLASQAAISLENAGLYQELQKYSQTLEIKNTQLNQINQSLQNEISERQKVEIALRAREQEREQLLEREQLARSKAESTNRIKDEFLAALSHELRTPLGPILGWVQFLRKQAGKIDPNTYKRAVDTIECNTQLEIKLVEDLLDVSQIIQGKLSLDSSAVELSEVITSAIETISLAASSKSIQIETLIEPSPIIVLGDSNRLQQIVWNLLSNAVKFTPQGGQVEIRLESINNYAQIKVSDTGIGINFEFLPFVFDAFRQYDGSTTRAFGGLGLGLAIVHQLVELHGGTVQAESLGLEQGATFTVNLPLLPTSTRNTNNQDLQVDDIQLEGVKILVVDDQFDMRELISFILEQSGALVECASSAAEALQIIQRFQPNLLLSDVGMAETDGYELIQQIQQIAGW